MTAYTELRKFVAPEFIYGLDARRLVGRYARNYALRRVLLVSDPGLERAGWLAEVEQLVVRYAAQMTRDVKVDDALFDALRAHFDTTQLVELTSAIATYNMVARFLVALGVSPEK